MLFVPTSRGKRCSIFKTMAFLTGVKWQLEFFTRFRYTCLNDFQKKFGPLILFDSRVIAFLRLLRRRFKRYLCPLFGLTPEICCHIFVHPSCYDTCFWLKLGLMVDLYSTYLNAYQRIFKSAKRFLFCGNF